MSRYILRLNKKRAIRPVFSWGIQQVLYLLQKLLSANQFMVIYRITASTSHQVEKARAVVIHAVDADAALDRVSAQRV